MELGNRCGQLLRTYLTNSSAKTIFAICTFPASSVSSLLLTSAGIHRTTYVYIYIYIYILFFFNVAILPMKHKTKQNKTKQRNDKKPTKNKNIQSKKTQKQQQKKESDNTVNIRRDWREAVQPQGSIPFPQWHWTPLKKPARGYGGGDAQSLAQKTTMQYDWWTWQPAHSNPQATQLRGG